MAAAARGAQQQGGRVLSLLPGKESRSTPVYADADLQVNTGLTANGRNIVMANAASAMVAVPGSHGSLQEMIIAVDAGTPVWAIGTHKTVLPGVEYVTTLDVLARQLRAVVDSLATPHLQPGPG